MTRRDGVSVQVQLAMYLDERHLATVASEDREHRGTQVFAAQRLGVGRYGRDGRWSAAVCDAEPVHDVLGVDAGPHDDAHFGKAGTHVGELPREGALRVVELCGLLEQHRALRMKRGEFARPMRKTPVARRIANGRHEYSQIARTIFGGAKGAMCRVCRAPAADENDRTARVRHQHPPPLPNPC